MEHRKISLRGRRILPRQKSRRWIAVLLTLSLISGLLSLSGPGAERARAEDSAGKNQVIAPGGTRYYNGSGAAVDAGGDYAVSVDKRITQAADPGGNPLENQFVVDLSVTTKINYQEITTTQDAAVVLVVDLSDSMVKECADCGRPVTAPAQPTIPYQGVNVHCAPNDIPKRACPQAPYGFYVSSGSACGNCGRPFSDHVLQHPFVSRLDVAKKVVANFLAEYQSSAKGAQRYLAAVGYDSSTYPYGWRNIVNYTQQDRNKFISDLFYVTTGSTATQSALAAARALLDKAPVPRSQSSVILLTDGLPNELSSNVIAPPSSFQTEYNASTAYCVANATNMPLFQSFANTFYNIASHGFWMRDSGASIYTVSFASGFEGSTGKPYSYSYLAKFMETFASEAFDANNAQLLSEAFVKIIKSMTEARPNTVTDPLPAWLRFDGFVGTPNAAVTDGTINWNLSNTQPNLASGNTYTYNLSYRVTMDNTSPAFPAAKAGALPVNDTAPMFTFLMYNQSTPTGPLHKVAFAVPQVKSYTADLSFPKVDPSLTPIKKPGENEAAKFTLSLPDKSWTAGTVLSNADGNVIFRALPSGHSYTLEEIRAPLDYTLGGTTSWPITVAWGQITQGVPDGKIMNQHDPVNTTFTVYKNWVCSGNTYQKQTVYFTIYLKNTTTVLGTGSMDIGNAVTPGGKQWQTTVILPTRNTTTGAELAYDIRETQLAGCTPTYSFDGHAFTITNIVSEYQDIVVHKRWIDPQPTASPEASHTLGTDAASPSLLPESSQSGALTESSAPEVTPTERAPDATPTGSSPETPSPESAPEAAPTGSVPEATPAAPPAPAGIQVGTQLPAVGLGGDPLSVPDTPRHPAATITLYLETAGGGSKVFDSYTFPAASNDLDVHTFANVPLADEAGTPYTYRITEGPVPGYTLTSIAMTATSPHFVLTNTSDQADITSVPFHKHWVGDDPVTRPSSITISLYADNSTDPIKSINLTEANRLENTADVWASSFEALPRYVGGGSSGTPIHYEVRENDVPPGYRLSYSGIDVINTWDRTSLTVYKNWIKPPSLPTPTATFRLLRNGVEFDSHTLQPGEASHTFSNLPISDASGNRYTYTATEDPVDKYTTTVNKTTFTNTLDQVSDVTVSGAIRWDLRGQPADVLPEQVTVQLYAGADVVASQECHPDANGNWSFLFDQDSHGNPLPRYTADRTGVISYSVRELGQETVDGPYTKPAPDKSTILLGNKDFGAHYDKVTVENNNHFVCGIFNHTDGEVAEYVSRIDRVYLRYVDSTLASSQTVVGTEAEGTRQVKQTAFSFSFDTDSYTSYGGHTYVFASGQVSIGSGRSGYAISGGENSLMVEQPDGELVATLYYELWEAAPTPPPPYVPDNPDPGPVTTPKPSVSPGQSPGVSPSPSGSPGVSPSPSASPGASPSPAPSATPPTSPAPSATPPTAPSPGPTPAVTPSTRPRPTQRPLTPEEQERVDQVVDEVARNPDIVIRTPEELQELYPELDLEDMPVPLFWGPDFAIIEGMDGEWIIIDSDLVPLGDLPQTGLPSPTPALWRTLSLLLAAGAAVLAAEPLIRRRRNEDNGA